MANVDTPFGLKPVRNAGSGPYNDGTVLFYAPASYATALFVGDPVLRAGSADSAGVPSINRAAATGAITGVVIGFQDPASMELGYGAASTDRYVLVRTDPETMYEVQVNGTLAAADVGLNANVSLGTGNTFSRKSGTELDAATKATTATLQLRILGFAQRPDNEIGADAKVYVKINNSTEVAGTASAGV